MLYLVLQLAPEQINALRPVERDAIQQLAGLMLSVYPGVALLAPFGMLTLVCIYLFLGFCERSEITLSIATFFGQRTGP